MQMHTGESLVPVTERWSWDERRKLGQRYLFSLARDYLQWFDEIKLTPYLAFYGEEVATSLRRRLELDGYLYKDGELLLQQEDILDVDQEKGIIQNLFVSAKLGRQEHAFEFLRLTEDHFVAEHWSDSISNARKFLELVLQEGATAIARAKGEELPKDTNQPAGVRRYFENQKLLELKERETLDKVYGLLSETGAHPYMAESDQARLLRQLVLTLAQFVLLRLDAALSQYSA